MSGDMRNDLIEKIVISLCGANAVTPTKTRNSLLSDWLNCVSGGRASGEVLSMSDGDLLQFSDGGLLVFDSWLWLNTSSGGSLNGFFTLFSDGGALSFSDDNLLIFEE